jgi:ABC-type glycerol-3-phosphate transport system substrate-binding protein
MLMKIIAILVLAVTFPLAACSSEVPCGGGNSGSAGMPGIFKFVKWDLKSVDTETTEITMTVHNATNENFNQAEIKIRWGDWHQFFFKLNTPSKANSDVTFVNSYGMPARDAKELQGTTPTLCTVKTVDESDTTKHYD